MDAFNFTTHPNLALCLLHFLLRSCGQIVIPEEILTFYFVHFSINAQVLS